MIMAYSTNPEALTRYLQRNGFTHTIGIYPGFDTERSDVPGRSTVSYRLGYAGADLTPEERRAHLTTHLHRMQRVLAKRYRVTLQAARENTLFWLRVEEDPHSILTPPQRKALDGIRAGGIVYRYKPLTPSLNRPEPLRPQDTALAFSGGLNAHTVLALERRGLVRFIPITPLTGRVEVLEPDTPGE